MIKSKGKVSNDIQQAIHDDDDEEFGLNSKFSPSFVRSCSCYSSGHLHKNLISACSLEKERETLAYVENNNSQMTNGYLSHIYSRNEFDV
jgi:hypothetical protein